MRGSVVNAATIARDARVPFHPDLQPQDTLMLVPRTPRLTARRADRSNPLFPVFTLGAAAGITLAFAGALATLAPVQPSPRETAPVFGPAVRLAVVQVVASR